MTDKDVQRIKWRRLTRMLTWEELVAGIQPPNEILRWDGQRLRAHQNDREASIGAATTAEDAIHAIMQRGGYRASNGRPVFRGLLGEGTARVQDVSGAQLEVRLDPQCWYVGQFTQLIDYTGRLEIGL